MILKLSKMEFILIGITIGVVFLMLFFNDICIHIRIKELKIFLQKSNIEDNNLDHIGLIMKYRLHKRMYENQISQGNAIMIEMRVNRIISELAFNKKILLSKYRHLARPTLATINFFRYIIGKNPIRDIEEDITNVYLDFAYYYERNKYYVKALKIYDKALTEEKNDRTKIAGILLHQGFCHSIIGNYKEARRKYLTVIEDYGDESSAITAAILLRYLEGFTSEVERVLKHERDSIVKGEKLYKLIAYKESIEVLKNIEKDVDRSEKSRIQFFKGRCHEELGEKEEAINIYQEIILKNYKYKSSYAKLANRRVYIIGSLAYDGTKIKQLAINNNQLLEDDVFPELAKKESNIYQAESLNDKMKRNELFRDTFKEIEVEKESSIINNEKLKSLDSLIERAEEEIEKKKKEGRKKVNKKIGITKVKIHTDDGNIFVGRITKETKDYIKLRTIIGSVKIDKKDIDKRESLE